MKLESAYEITELNKLSTVRNQRYKTKKSKRKFTSNKVILSEFTNNWHESPAL